MAVLSAVESGAPESAADSQLAYVPVGGDEVRVGLADAWALRLYPEAIALAPVIATPRWRQHAAGDADQLAVFVAEVRRRLRDRDYQPRGEQDAIAHWIEVDCWRAPTTPPTTFEKAPGHRKPSQLRHRNQFSDERTWRSATWFGLKNRRGAGDVVLHHRTLRPVIVREWSPDMQEYRGAIWNSQRTEARFKRPQAAE